jgi:predicted O-methyltransferase YrrM
MGDEIEGSTLSKADVLPYILSKESDISRDEPEIAANISQQLQHMGLSTWSLSIIRRLRNAIHKLKPRRVIEVGAGIGHRSAWLYDLFTNHTKPERYDLVEQGAKFAVILHRLMTRYESEDWTNIVVGEVSSLVAETTAWKAASATGLEVGDSPLALNSDVIIVDSKIESLAESIDSLLPILSDGGVLFTCEPPVPTGDIDENDKEMMKHVNGFNSWIELISRCQETHYVAFTPLFEGTLVAFLAKN